MKILAVVASGRKEGNVNKLCDGILNGASESKHEVKKVNLFDYEINPCTGCMSCSKTRKCIINDDFNELFELEKESDYLIYGFPIYWHSIPGILKIFIERHWQAISVYYDNQKKRTFWKNIGYIMDLVKKVRNNHPYINKKLTTVITCNDPFGGSDVSNAKHIIKNFCGQMGLISTEEILYSGTLFRKINKILTKSYKIGKNIK